MYAEERVFCPTRRFSDLQYESESTRNHLEVRVCEHEAPPYELNSTKATRNTSVEEAASRLHRDTTVLEQRGQLLSSTMSVCPSSISPDDYASEEARGCGGKWCGIRKSRCGCANQPPCNINWPIIAFVLLVSFIIATFLAILAWRRRYHPQFFVLTAYERRNPAEPLHKAAFRGNVAQCRALLASGADINATDKTGATPLHAAHFFLRGLDDWLINLDGMDTLYDVAAAKFQCAELLLAEGARTDLRDANGATPLELTAPFAVARAGLADALKLMLERLGLDPLTCASAGLERTPAPVVPRSSGRLRTHAQLERAVAASG